jgi:flagellar protein FliL
MTNLDAGVDEEASAEAKPGLLSRFSRRVLIIAGAAGLLLLLGAGAGTAYLLGWFGGASAEDIALEQASAPVFYFDLPEITVNLSNAEQRAQYLRMEVVLEIPDQALIGVIEPNLPRILDVFQTYLRELRVSDLEGSAGLFRLKHELQRRINLAIYPAEVDAVLFREIIVQ